MSLSRPSPLRDRESSDRMPHNGPIDVQTWQMPIGARPRSVSRSESGCPPSLVGILGTVLLHGLLIQSIVLNADSGRPQPPSKPTRSSLGTSPHSDPDEAPVTVTLITNVATASGNVTESDLQPALEPVPQLVDKGSSDRAFNTPMLPMEDIPASRSSAGGDDGAELSRLAGIYSGQIRARIERVWERPRGPINARPSSGPVPEYFQCQVQIVQDLSGAVQEILLPVCNGDSRWQRSLVAAIQLASPLPAPPSPTVFARSIVLSFTAYPYRDGQPADGYERDSRSETASAVDDGAGSQ